MVAFSGHNGLVDMALKHIILYSLRLLKVGGPGIMDFDSVGTLP